MINNGVSLYLWMFPTIKVENPIKMDDNKIVANNSINRSFLIALN